MNEDRAKKVLGYIQFLTFSNKPIPPELNTEGIQARTVLNAIWEERRKERLTRREQKNVVDHYEWKDKARKIE